jgi:D-psicose/D-tagatose/L-ribulose 3-epimerase
MQFGVCGDPKMAVAAKKAGFDYFEWSVGGLLHPHENENVFEQALRQARESGLPCPVLNIFIPADLKITGPDADLARLESFVRTALRRAQTAEVDTIVFGSGGARRIPDGYSRKTAWKELAAFCKMLGPIAQQHGVTIVIEPLNLDECNVLNTVQESADLVREVNHPNIRLLVDGYHWAKDADSSSAILNNAGLLVHAHVATREERLPPNPQNPCSEFLTVLSRSGYHRRISIEGVIPNPETDLPQALAILKGFFNTPA